MMNNINNNNNKNKNNRRSLVLLGIFSVTTIITGIALVGSISNYQDAQKELDAANADLEQSNRDLAHEYGMCVFYYEQTVEYCNEASDNKGLPLYEKYYGDGSWTVAGK